MTSSALYLLPGGCDAKGSRQRLIWGIPVDIHISFHGLAWGPEGDLYFTAGDPLLNYGDYNRADHWGHWTIYSQPAGTRSEYTGVGGVFRCHPDGSGFRVVATGLRGPAGWCSITTGICSPTTTITSHCRSITSPRAVARNAAGRFRLADGWMAEKTPTAKNCWPRCSPAWGEVPIGQTYYDEDYLPPAHRGHLLVAEWGAWPWPAMLCNPQRQLHGRRAIPADGSNACTPRRIVRGSRRRRVRHDRLHGP